MICSAFCLFYTRWQCVQDVKMSLLRQLPLVDSRLFPLANSKITCWCISYCCSGDVVIYSPAFFMSTFILISRVQNSSFSSNSISFGVMHLLKYNEGRSFCTHRRKEAWCITEKMVFAQEIISHDLSVHVKNTVFIRNSSSPIFFFFFFDENNISCVEQLNVIFHSGDWKQNSYIC